MALLKLNGVAVEATDSEWEPVRLGEVVRSLNGAPRSTAKVRKANVRYTSGLLTVPQAQVLRSLIEGEGHVLSFDDASSATSYLYTSREVAPSDYLNCTRVAGRHGGGALHLGDNGSVTWQLAPMPRWTVMAWLMPPGSSTWHHHVWGSHVGTEWVNGAQSGTPYLVDPPGTLEETCWVDPPGTLIATATIHGALSLDDIVVLPYTVPDEWVPALYAFHMARAWPALPYVLAEGPRLPADGLLCLGEAGAAPARLLRNSVGEVLDFTLYGT